eukprot:1764346-Pyramimonas_sp.AAC.1
MATSLPCTPSGKVQKRLLQSAAEAAAERQWEPVTGESSPGRCPSGPPDWCDSHERWVPAPLAYRRLLGPPAP